MKLRHTIAALIRGQRDALAQRKERLEAARKERHAVYMAPADIKSIKAAFARSTNAIADSVCPFSKLHFASRHAALGGGFFDSIKTLSLLGIPNTAPPPGSAAPTLETADGRTNMGAYTFIHREAIHAANNRFIDAVYEDLPGALSTDERTKKLDALDNEIKELEAEIEEIEAEFHHARRAVS